MTPRCARAGARASPSAKTRSPRYSRRSRMSTSPATAASAAPAAAPAATGAELAWCTDRGVAGGATARDGLGGGCSAKGVSPELWGAAAPFVGDAGPSYERRRSRSDPRQMVTGLGLMTTAELWRCDSGMPAPVTGEGFHECEWASSAAGALPMRGVEDDAQTASAGLGALAAPLPAAAGSASPPCRSRSWSLHMKMTGAALEVVLVDANTPSSSGPPSSPSKLPTPGSPPSPPWAPMR
mmetsp:Transcript_86549/g.245440  ORF Transcript_86549/g.245440 Transcript_86549/m.245440 type:complete len:239 (+) Transcript_86549:196-912(+)